MRLKKGDLLIVVLLVIALLSTFGGRYVKEMFLSGRMDKTAVIKIDGEIYATIPLKRSNERQEIPLSLSDGHYIRIVTEKDKIWVEESSCPDEVCVLTGKIDAPGESIVCLPNKTIILIEGTKKTDIDDISI